MLLDANFSEQNILPPQPSQRSPDKSCVGRKSIVYQNKSSQCNSHSVKESRTWYYLLTALELEDLIECRTVAHRGTGTGASYQRFQTISLDLYGFHHLGSNTRIEIQLHFRGRRLRRC